MTPILEIDGLSKRFRLGAGGKSNFREAITDGLRHPGAPVRRAAIRS